MSLDRAQALERVLDNCIRVLLMVEEQIVNPTQSNVDAIVAAAATTGLVIPKPQYSLDGESYSWPAYAESLQKRISELPNLIVQMQGPFQFTTHSR